MLALAFVIALAAQAPAEPTQKEKPSVLVLDLELWSFGPL